MQTTEIKLTTIGTNDFFYSYIYILAVKYDYYEPINKCKIINFQIIRINVWFIW